MRSLSLSLSLVLIAVPVFASDDLPIPSGILSRLDASTAPSSRVYFTANAGQYPVEVAFNLRLPWATAWVLEEGLVHQLFAQRDGKTVSCLVRMHFVDAQIPTWVEGARQLPHDTNFCLGNDPARWAENVPSYEVVFYRDLYPGIDLKLYTSGAGLRYDFLLSPGADPSSIRIRVDGTEALGLDSTTGQLLMETQLRTITQSPPKIYQEDGVSRLPVEGRFHLLDGQTFGFVLSESRSDLPLVIDPAFTYGSYLGGESKENGSGFSGTVYPGPDGTVFVFGVTESSDFPDSTINGRVWEAPRDLFVTKFRASGEGDRDLLYNTFLGGSGAESAWAMVADGDGRAYVAGQFASTDWTPGVCPHSSDGVAALGFAVVLSPTGSLEHGTLVEHAKPIGIQIVSGSVFNYEEGNTVCSGVMGCPEPGTVSTEGYFVALVGAAHDDFLTTTDAFDRTWNRGVAPGYPDAFLRVYTPDLSCVAYSTYLGSGGFDESWGVEFDDAGVAYVVGAFGMGPGPSDTYDCALGHFPLEQGGTASIFDSIHGPPGVDPILTEGFILALEPEGGNPTGSCQLALDKLVFSTYVGGDDDTTPSGGTLEYAFVVELDDSGNVYVAGSTPADVDFPLLNPIDTPLTPGGAPSPIGLPGSGVGHDGFIVKLNSLGEPIFSTYFTGTDNEDQATANGYEWVYAIEIDPGDPDAFWIAGQTESTSYNTDVPSTALVTAPQPELADDFDIFVAKLRQTTGPPVIEYFTYLGGLDFETQKNMYVDDSGNLYVGGWTTSDDFPTTTGAYDMDYSDTSIPPASDVFFVRFDIADEFIRGDANQDGVVSAPADLDAISAALSTGPPLACADSGDVNDDGVFDLADRTYLYAFLFSNGPAPPAPFSSCGNDSTPDGLAYCQFSCP